MPKPSITPTETAVLEVIELDMKLAPGSLYIDELVKGTPAVFFKKNGLSACVCALESSYWNECKAKVETTALLARLSTPTGKKDSHD